MILKTIFRSFRKFFIFKFEALLENRDAKRRLHDEHNYIALIEEFIQQEFLEGQNPNVREILSNYSAALIYPKDIKRELIYEKDAKKLARAH